MSAIETSLMNTVNVPVARPKVHRLPSSVKKKPARRTSVPGFLMFWGAIFMVLLAVSMAIKKDPVIIKANYVPAVSVTPEALPQPKPDVQAKTAPQEPEASAEDPGLLSSSIGDAQASTAVAAPVDNSSKTIILKGKSEGIIGQMAKINAGNEQITEIKAVSDIDNGAGRELLSIVSKY